MTINKLAIIGGSGLYDVEEFKERELLRSLIFSKYSQSFVQFLITWISSFFLKWGGTLRIALDI